MARYDVDALIEEALGEAQGHTVDQGSLTWLTTAITDIAATAMTVDTSGSRLSRGIAEVGDELVYVAGVNQDSGVCTLAPFGRGYQGTTAQTHAINTRVTMAPRWPRSRILNYINDLLLTTYPFIFAVDTTTLSVGGGGVITYELPADVERVLRVEVSTVGPSDDWELVERWSFNRSADTGQFATGKSLDVIEYLIPGRTIQVLYAKRPTALTLNDTFTDCGLRTSAWPAIMYGVVHRMLTGAVAGESGSESVQAAEKNRAHRSDPAGVQREYYTLHRQYLVEERDRLLQDFPATNNMER